MWWKHKQACRGLFQRLWRLHKTSSLKRNVLERLEVMNSNYCAHTLIASSTPLCHWFPIPIQLAIPYRLCIYGIIQCTDFCSPTLVSDNVKNQWHFLTHPERFSPRSNSMAITFRCTAPQPPIWAKHRHEMAISDTTRAHSLRLNSFYQKIEYLQSTPALNINYFSKKVEHPRSTSTKFHINSLQTWQ